MISSKRGFTLVEVVVVVAIIGILATIITLGLNKYTQDSRDAQRATDVTSLSEALEKYYDKHGEYPSCTQMTSSPSVISQSILTGIDQSVFVTPGTESGTTTSITCDDIATLNEDAYQYQGDGSVNCATGNACLSYMLRYREESSGNIIEVKSRRTVAISTSGIPVLTASGSAMNAINASWSAVPNALNYQIQIATNSAFTSGLTSQTLTSNSTSFSSLAYNTTYYLRVKAISNGNQGAWSNVVTTATYGLTAPTLTVTASTATQTNTSWSSVPGSTGYTLQWSTDQSTWSSSSPTGTSQTVTGLTGGTLYYYRVQAKWNSNVGPWSSVKSAYTVPGGPTGLTISASMSGTSAVGTAGATCSAGTVQYQLRNRNTNTTAMGAWSAWSAWSTADTDTESSTAQGYQYGFQMQARCMLGTTPSDTVTLATVATTVRNFDAPSKPSVSAGTSGATTTFTRTSSPTCSGNGTTGYQYKRTIDSGSVYNFATTTATSVATTTSTEGYAYGIEWQARCTNTYATGPWSSSGTASYIRPVSPAARQTFNGYRGAWNIMYLEVTSSCQSGGSLYGAVDVHTWDWAWTPGNHFGWRRNSLGWVVAENWRANTTLTGSQSSSGIPSGSRWNVGGYLRCQNYTTGRNSGGNVWQESGIFTAS